MELPEPLTHNAVGMEIIMSDLLVPPSTCLSLSLRPALDRNPHTQAGRGAHGIFFVSS